jgi:hypothetical protein
LVFNMFIHHFPMNMAINSWQWRTLCAFFNHPKNRCLGCTSCWTGVPIGGWSTATPERSHHEKGEKRVPSEGN